MNSTQVTVIKLIPQAGRHARLNNLNNHTAAVN